MAGLKYWVWLADKQNVSARAKRLLIDHYGDAERAFFAPEGEFGAIAGITAADAEKLEKRDTERAEKILERCEAQGIDILTINDAAYPARLRNVCDAPVALYVKGKLPSVDDEPAVAVIGTRRASPYGIKMARNIAYEICKCGGTVISGLTAGIDESAAKGALLAGGKCIAVLGTAHEESTSKLLDDIVKNGAAVSEYAPGTRTMKSFFRARNRIASGLSAGVTVVEAPRESGALLFAAEAQEQGREIFAVPGNADSENSAGTLELLKRGARPAACGWDVMEELAPMFPGKIKDAVSYPCPEEKGAEPQRKITRAAQKPQKVIDKKKDTGYIDLKDQLAGLSEEQLKIIAAIDKDGSGIDDIIEGTELSTAKVLSQLTILEIRGFVRRAAGRRIILNIRSEEK